MGLLRTIPNLELHLVLSAASGAREIGASARQHRELGIHRLIFTKLDEADGPGSILSALAALPRPVSCATNGQRVPDDLQTADGPLPGRPGGRARPQQGERGVDQAEGLRKRVASSEPAAAHPP